MGDRFLFTCLACYCLVHEDNLEPHLGTHGLPVNDPLAYFDRKEQVR